jgi:hypothetical protein
MTMDGKDKGEFKEGLGYFLMRYRFPVFLSHPIPGWLASLRLCKYL